MSQRSPERLCLTLKVCAGRSWRLGFLQLASFAGLAILIAAGTSRAQVGNVDSDPGDPGTGGKNIIQGNIYYENGQRLDHRVKVTLRGLDNSTFSMSDDSGAFTFRRLKGGSYTVQVDAGTQFQIASENVDVIEVPRRRTDLGQTYTLQITLHPAKAGVRTIGTVDASAGNVPEPALRLYKEALEAIHASNSKKAIEDLQEALKLYPAFVPALNELGVQYMRLKEYDKADASLKEAVRLAPDAFTPLLNYGTLLMLKKDYVLAASELERAVQKDSSKAEAHYQLGRAYAYVGVYPKAEKELLQTISMGGDHAVEAHRFLGAAYIELHDNAHAIEQLEMYLSLAPKAPDAEKIRTIVKQLRSQK